MPNVSPEEADSRRGEELEKKRGERDREREGQKRRRKPKRREMGGRGHKNLFCFSLRTVAFQRHLIAASRAGPLGSRGGPE